jgi:hypothetical protein
MMSAEIGSRSWPTLESYVGLTTSPVVRATESEDAPGALIVPGLRIQLTLRCSLPLAGEVRLSVLDDAGHAVRTLRDGWMAAGECLFVWDQRDDEGKRLYAGQYRVRFEAAGRVLEQEVMLLP